MSVQSCVTLTPIGPIGRPIPIVVFQSFPTHSDAQALSSLSILAVFKWKVLDTVFATLGCSSQRLHYSQR